MDHVACHPSGSSSLLLSAAIAPSGCAGLGVFGKKVPRSGGQNTSAAASKPRHPATSVLCALICSVDAGASHAPSEGKRLIEAAAGGDALYATLCDGSSTQELDEVRSRV